MNKFLVIGSICFHKGSGREGSRRMFRRPQESIFVRDRRFFAAAFSEIDLDNIDTREE